MLDQLGGGRLPPSNGAAEDAGRLAVRLVEHKARMEQLQEQTEESQPEPPKKPQTEKTVQEVRSAWLQKSLSEWVNKVESELLGLLLNWQPSAGTLEENLQQLQALLKQYQQQLSEQGQPLLLDGALEDALLEALARLLERQAGEFLRLTGNSATQSELETLLNRVFTQVTGEKASHEGLSNGANHLRQFAGETGGRGMRQFPGRESGAGVIYQQATAGVRISQPYGGPGGTRGRTPYPVLTAGWGGRLPDPPLTGRGIQLVERFARFLQTAEPVPKRELPFTSEERLGLELGIIALKGELTAARPELVPPLSSMVRGATVRYVQDYLVRAERELGHYAVHHPPVDVCPAFRQDVVMQVYQYLLAAYRKGQDPEQAVLRTLKYALAQFQEKQEEIPYQSWLRYCLGRNFFEVLQSGAVPQDQRRGWGELCRRWNQFFSDMEFTGSRFRESVWGLVAQPSTASSSGPVVFPPLRSVGRWLLVGVGVLLALAGLLLTLSGPARAGCLVIGGALALAAVWKR